MTITSEAVFFAPKAEVSRRNGYTFLIDPEGPNWLAVGSAGTSILERFDGTRTFGEVVGEYARETHFEFAKAWHHVQSIVQDAVRQKFLRTKPFQRSPYLGRLEHVKDEPLRELWLHTNNSCNLACSHCLVSSGPDGDPGMDTEKLLAIIHRARELGAQRFCFTGGHNY